MSVNNPDLNGGVPAPEKTMGHSVRALVPILRVRGAVGPAGRQQRGWGARWKPGGRREFAWVDRPYAPKVHLDEEWEEDDIDQSYDPTGEDPEGDERVPPVGSRSRAPYARFPTVRIPYVSQRYLSSRTRPEGSVSYIVNGKIYRSGSA